jgi:hypothetical protein
VIPIITKESNNTSAKNDTSPKNAFAESPPLQIVIGEGECVVFENLDAIALGNRGIFRRSFERSSGSHSVYTMITEVQTNAEKMESRFDENTRAALADIVSRFMSDTQRSSDQNKAKNRREAIRFILEKMLDSTPFIQRICADALLTFADPREIHSVGLSQYRLNGYEGRLLLVDSLLRRFGVTAWSVLERFAESGKPECEFFVYTIASMDGVPRQKRLDALAKLALNPDAGTREKVFEMLQEIPLEAASEALRILASTGELDDYARVSAKYVVENEM